MPMPHPFARPHTRPVIRPLVRRMIQPLVLAAERVCASWDHQRRRQEDEYLAAATDLCDLERRLNELERRG